LNAEPALHRELEAVTLAIVKRLSSAEKADLRGGNVTELASSLGINAEQGTLLRSIHERTSALQETARRQNRERVQGSQLDIRR
jgi:hypothetical protein